MHTILPLYLSIVYQSLKLSLCTEGRADFLAILPLFCRVCSASCQHSFLPESEQERRDRYLHSSAASTVILIFSLQCPVTSVPCRSHRRPSLRPSPDVTFHSNLKIALESRTITVFLNHIHFPTPLVLPLWDLTYAMQYNRLLHNGMKSPFMGVAIIPHAATSLSRGTVPQILSSENRDQLTWCAVSLWISPPTYPVSTPGLLFLNLVPISYFLHSRN